MRRIKQTVGHLLGQVDHRRLLNTELDHREHVHASEGGADQLQALRHQADAGQEKYVAGEAVTGTGCLVRSGAQSCTSRQPVTKPVDRNDVEANQGSDGHY